MSWRRLILPVIVSLKEKSVAQALADARACSQMSRDEMNARQQKRLTALLRHAADFCPYYKEVLGKAGVVEKGSIRPDRFHQIPFLTKEELRTRSEKLLAVGGFQGKPMRNTTGGSTGEPVVFWQDKRYIATNIANKLFCLERLGKRLGEREMKIWGSERDLFEGTIGWKAKAQFFLYNRRFENCFHLTQKRILDIFSSIQSWRPDIIWGYVDALYVLANEALRKQVQLPPPKAVICAAGTLHPSMKEVITNAFGAPAINDYGSREMGSVCQECLHTAGLHLMPLTHLVEIIGADGTPADPGQEGEIVITSLTNYAMPFIRYRTGDRGCLSLTPCACGEATPMLTSISGRIMETFVSKCGDLVPPEYFIHLVGVVFNKGFIRRFQIVQEADYSITLNLVIHPEHQSDALNKALANIDEKIRLVMGQDCAVAHRFVDDIPCAASGKYLYTVSKVVPL